MRMQTVRIVFAAVAASAAAEVFAATYRIDEIWSLDRVNALAPEPGSRILFKRGGVWLGQLKPWSGEPGRPATYGTWGGGLSPS